MSWEFHASFNMGLHGSLYCYVLHVQCSYTPYAYHWLPASSVVPLSPRVEQSTSIPTTLYEFPNGYNINLTIEKFKLCEGLFDASTSNLKVCVQSCTL